MNRNGILLSKLYWPTVKKIVLVIEKNFEAEGWEFAKNLRSQFIRTVKGQIWINGTFFQIFVAFSESLNFNNTYHCEILGKPIIRMAKNRKKVSDTARPDKIDENEFRNFKSTLSDNRVPKIPKIEMDVSVTPSR